MTQTKETAEKKNISEHFIFLLRNRHDAVAAAAVLLLFGIVVFGIYSQTLESPFVFDDIFRIEENPHIRLTQLSFKETVKAGVKSSKTRPVAFITFALNYYFNQYDPVGYHIVNFCIHIFAGLFLFLFIRTTFQTPALRQLFEHPNLIAFMAALMWIAHPVQTQSVTYIVQRMNSMASLLFVVSFWFYVRGRLVQGDRKKWLWYIGSTLTWLVSLGCKQITVTLPLLIFIYEWYFFQKLSKDWLKRSLKWVLGPAVLLALIALIYTNFDPLQKFSQLNDFSKNEFTVAQRALTQLRVVIYYISLLFYPHPSRLNLDYNFPLSYSLIDPITTALCLIIIVGLVLLSAYLAKKHRLISFCILWFFGNLAIESSVIPLALIFEHRLYLPSMFVSLLFVVILYRHIKWRWLSVSIACSLVLLLSYWTLERNKVWQDEITLWTDSIKKAPDKARPYANLGMALAESKRPDEALQNYHKALQIDPDFVEALYNLGSLLGDQGKLDEAIAQYRKAVKVDPNYVKAYNNMGIALIKQDKVDEAIEQYHKALQISPNFAKTHTNLGLALIKSGKIDEAVEHLNKALQINPNLAEAQLNLGNTLIGQGNTEMGVHRIKRALQLDPDYAEAHNNLGGQLLKQGKLDEALEHLNRAVSINPQMAEAHNNIGIILIQRGNLNDAITHFQDAVRIRPDFQLAQNNLQRAFAIRNEKDPKSKNIQSPLKSNSEDPDLHYRLGNNYLAQGNLPGAIIEFEKALALRPTFLAAQNNLALAYAANQQYEQALTAFKKLIELDPANTGAYYNIAVLYALQNKVPEAIDWLKQAVDKGYQNWRLIKNDKDLANIRDTEEYRRLVEGR